MPATTPATPARIKIDFLPDLELCLVEGGRFDMGDEHGDLWDACRPVHPVEVSAFYIGKWQVTQRLWQELMGENPSSFKGDRHPVESVSWDDTRIFLQKINTYPGRETLTGTGITPCFPATQGSRVGIRRAGRALQPGLPLLRQRQPGASGLVLTATAATKPTR